MTLPPAVRAAGSKFLTELGSVPELHRFDFDVLRAAFAWFNRLLECSRETLFLRDGMRFSVREVLPPPRRRGGSAPAVLFSSEHPVGTLLATADPGLAFRLSAAGETPAMEPLPAGLLVFVMAGEEEAEAQFYVNVAHLLCPATQTDAEEPLRVVERRSDSSGTYWVPNRSPRGREEMISDGYLRVGMDPTLLAEPGPSRIFPPLSMQQAVGPFLLNLPFPDNAGLSRKHSGGATQVRNALLQECFRRGVNRLGELPRIFIGDRLEGVKDIGKRGSGAILVALAACGLRVQDGKWFLPPPEPMDQEEGPNLPAMTVTELIAEAQTKADRMMPPRLREALVYVRRVPETLGRLVTWGDKIQVRDLPSLPVKFVEAATRSWELPRFEVFCDGVQISLREEDLRFLQVLLWWNGLSPQEFMPFIPISRR